MTLTFLDASVLIAAARGDSPQAEAALALFDDPTREFASSVYLRLEVLPRAVFNHRAAEIAFYQAYFEAVKVWAENHPAILDLAYRVSAENGLEAVVGAEELVTCEKRTRSIHRAEGVRVLSLHPAGS